MLASLIWKELANRLIYPNSEHHSSGNNLLSWKKWQNKGKQGYQLTKLEKMVEQRKQGYQEGLLLEPRQQCQRKWKYKMRDNLREEGMSSNQLDYGGTEPQQSLCEEEK